MTTTTLQIPMSSEVRAQAARTAIKQGFSSLQEVVRLFLNQFANQQIKVFFTAPNISLSAKNDERYSKMIKEIKTGKVKTKAFSEAGKLMDYLNQ
jgi:antitoxin component of RelBE/YafQ-DinJ toxin-antitoxin module